MTDFCFLMGEFEYTENPSTRKVHTHVLTASTPGRMLRIMERKDYRLAAILYTDIAGFSKMMEKNEARTLDLLTIHNRIIEEIVAEKGGKVIKTIGDAFLLDFKNTVDALQSAIEIQYRLYEYNKKNPDLPLLVRIGAHLGDIYFYENDALGEGINIASRLQSVAHPGCICMSQDVYNHVLNKVEFKAEKLGRVSLKNITKEIHAYEIATPNVEFDPNRNAPTILHPDQIEKGVAPLADGLAAAGSASAGDPASGSTAADIKRRILLDIKAAGRRLGADQMRVRYGHEGPAAEAVISDMANKGLLLRETPPVSEVPAAQAAQTAQPARADDIVHVVSDLEYRIEDEIRRGISKAFERRREFRDRRSRRHERANPESRWERKWEKSSFHAGSDLTDDYERYVRDVRKEAGASVAGFIGHLIPFVAVNAFLMFLNAATSPGFPWFIFPFGGWGIGLLEHFLAVMRKGEKAKELRALPPLNADQLELFKQLQKRKDSIWMHFGSTVTVSLFLAAINIVTSPGFFWFLFPAVGMTIGLLSHMASYAVKKRELQRDLLDSIGFKGSWDRALRKAPKEQTEPAKDLGPYAGLVEEARSVRAAIAAQLAATTAKSPKGKKEKKGLGSEVPVDADILPTLDSYVEQVALLAERTNEVDRIIELIPMDALAVDKQALIGKMEEHPGEGLRKEYQKSLAELEKQESSYNELREQREVLELRLRSSVNTMKQMRIDLARLAGMPQNGESASANVLRDKTAELNRYLGDLRAGYDELDALEARALGGHDNGQAENVG